MQKISRSQGLEVSPLSEEKHFIRRNILYQLVILNFSVAILVFAPRSLPLSHYIQPFTVLQGLLIVFLVNVCYLGIFALNRSTVSRIANRQKQAAQAYVSFHNNQADLSYWYIYFHTELIDQVYEALFGPIPNQIIKKQYEKGSNSFTSRLSSDVSILKKIGISVSDEQKGLLENGYSSELKWSIPSSIKFREIRTALHDRGSTLSLNDSIKDYPTNPGLAPFLTFEASVLFGFEIDFDRTTPDTLVVFRRFKEYEDFHASNVEFIPLIGSVEGYYFFYYCSKRYFFEISKSEILNLIINSELTAGWLPNICRGFSAFKGIVIPQHRLDMKPLALSIGGESGDRITGHDTLARHYEKSIPIGPPKTGEGDDDFWKMIGQTEIFSTAGDINKFPELDREESR